MASRRNSAIWDRRIARARELAHEHAAARETLTFYACLADYQRSLFEAAVSRSAADFADAVDLDSASAAVAAFLAWLERTGPPALTVVLHRIRREPVDWRQIMHSCLRQLPEQNRREEASAVRDAKTFVVEALLQPYAEAAALDRRQAPPRHSNPSGGPRLRCPICSSLPCVAVLREAGHGAKRTFLCARCATEWDHLRIVCPNCSEAEFDALAVYTSETCPDVRIDACDTCRTYIKTIDCTSNGLAVPLVDDIASVALDLWAMEQGYRRLQANLLRTSVPATTEG